MNNFVKKVPLIAVCIGLGTPGLSFARDVDDIVNDWWKSTSYLGANGGSSFDMLSDDIPSFFDAHVYKVLVRHGSRIDAIKFNWDYKGESKTTSSEYYGGSGGSQSSFTLDDNEYIRKIKICDNGEHDRVGYIKFWTNFGNYYDFGDTQNTCRTWSYSDQHIIGLWGREGDEIDKAGIVVAPRVNLDVTDIEINEDTYSTLTTSTTASSTQVLFNDTSTSQSTSVSVAYTDKTEFTNTYSETSGISSTYGIEVGVSTDWFDLFDVSTKLSTSVTSEESLTIGESITESSWSTTTITVNATVPANAIVVAEAIVYYTEEEVDYTMTVENTYTDEEFNVEGTFTGINTNVYGSWSQIGTIENGVIDIYEAFEDEYGYYE